MIVQNVRQAAVWVKIYVNGRPGVPKLVMKGTPENLYGPAFMKGAGGEDIYMTVPGTMIVADEGAAPKARNLICVRMEPVSLSWTDSDGIQYRVVAQDYRYQPPARPSR